MEIQSIFGLILVTVFFYGAQSAQFTFKNNCPFTVWPGTQNIGGRPPLSSTGFELASKASSTLNVPASWSGRFWARTQCASDAATGKFTCATADCGLGQVYILTCCNGAGPIPPASLLEFTLSAANNGQDFYDISLVDGFNLPLSITPQPQLQGARSGRGSCPATTCSNNVNEVCPPELAVKGSNGSVIACKSACLAFNQPQYCCTGDYGTPEKCRPTKYSLIFKHQCPQAYTYAYDDKSSLFTCTAAAKYVVTFCP
ncbi:hypothetical protein ACOSQ4_030139 [Xanthoceras sorbifolium]